MAWMLCIPAFGARFVVDKGASQLAVDAKASPPHTFTSEARAFACDIELEPESLTAQKAYISFSFADLDSGKEKRDEKMLKWMDVDKHPDAQFELMEVLERDGELIGLGTFSMHGISREIEVPFSIRRDGERITIDGTADFDYTDWNLKIVRLLIFSVNPELRVHFHLEGELQA